MATSKFGQAFADARKSGAKTFEFGGKKFTTQTKDDAKASPRSIASTSSSAQKAGSDYMKVAKLNAPAGASQAAVDGLAKLKASSRSNYETKAKFAESARTGKSVVKK